MNWRNKSSMMRTQTGQLEEASAALLSDMHHLAETESVVKSMGDRVDEDTLQSVTLADKLTTNLTALNVLIEEMISDWELYSVHQDLDPEVIRKKTAMAEGMVTLMKKLDLSPREPTATDESTEAHDREENTCMRAHTHFLMMCYKKAAFVVPFVCCSVLRHVRQLEKKLISTEGRVAPVREVLSRFTKKLSEAQEILQKAANTVQETEDMNKANTVKFQRSEVTSHNPGVRLAQTVPPGAALVLPPQMSLAHSLTLSLPDPLTDFLTGCLTDCLPA
uniref:Uncharacterized protein n=1 Tax=Hucho hucho TaxID=62062 RepID=A0A4W5N9M6_9TELE